MGSKRRKKNLALDRKRTDSTAENEPERFIPTTSNFSNVICDNVTNETSVSNERSHHNDNDPLARVNDSNQAPVGGGSSRVARLSQLDFAHIQGRGEGLFSLADDILKQSFDRAYDEISYQCDDDINTSYMATGQKKLASYGEECQDSCSVEPISLCVIKDYNHELDQRGDIECSKDNENELSQINAHTPAGSYITDNVTSTISAFHDSQPTSREENEFTIRRRANIRHNDNSSEIESYAKNDQNFKSVSILSNRLSYIRNSLVDYKQLFKDKSTNDSSKIKSGMDQDVIVKNPLKVTKYKTVDEFEQYRASPTFGNEDFKRRRYETTRDFILRRSTSIFLLLILGFLGFSLITWLVFQVEKETNYLGFVETNSLLGRYKRYAVSTDAQPCSKVGAKILSKRGNAVEAAIGTLICMGLVLPNSLGIGGGCLMTIYNPRKGEAIAINGRETAPKFSTENMFKSDWLLASRGPLSVGVPGELAAYAKAYEMFGGNVKWSDLFEDSIRMAKEGVPVVEHLASAVRDRSHTIYMSEELRSVFVNKTTNQLVQVGDRIRMDELARTLEIIRDKGVDAFYRGHLGELFVKDLRDMGGNITIDDLRDYSVVVEKALKVELADDLTLFTQPIPGSGIVLSIIMRIMKKLGYYKNLRPQNSFDESSLYYHRLIEAFKFGYAQRAGLEDKPDDPDRLERLMKRLSSNEFIDYAVDNIDELAHNDNRYLDNETFYKEDSGTAHVSVIDGDGMAVAVTTSVNLYFGSGLVSKSTGIIYNDVMDDFVSPNITNKFGVSPSMFNRIRPGRRPISSMAPSVFVDEKGNAILSIGSSGGTKITTSVASVGIRHLYFGEDIKTAIDSRRLHHQFLPNTINYEPGFDNDMLQSLIDRGHVAKPIVGRSSVVMAVGKEYQSDGTTVITANSDARKGGSVDGY